MEFEFDEEKNKSNQVKHGIDFVEAQKLWLDINRVEIAARRARDEEIKLYEG
ncbi:MAG: BrnT family toxin [Trichormus sp. ATA11-4-KO1]|jgi:hypothetical protein|nr:BrnT family toxin [Trichormus sp. ATA11-4-KO1]